MPTLVLQGVPSNASNNTLYLRRIYTITGVTKFANNTTVPFCPVHLFRFTGDLRVDIQTSDASGNYTVSLYDQERYYVVGNTEYTADSIRWNADSTVFTADASEYEGVTINTLIGV